MNLLIYFLNARSVAGGFENIFDAFGYFLLNWLILTAFYSVSLFFARRIFVMTLISIIWLALGVINCVLLGMRENALEAIDFQILRTGFAIITVYLNAFQIILYSVLILAAIAVLVILFVKCPKIRPKYLYALLVIICLLLVISIVIFGIVESSRNKNEITSDSVGFPYFFLCSVFDRGIDRPVDYSAEKVNEITSSLAKYGDKVVEKTPNVIFVQLESFFDVNRLEEIEFSENPIPNFTALKEKYASGLFTVKSIGSGTANTEFEVLSGLDLNFFGVGEYPYTSILGDRCCETIAYDLAEYGYTSHAIHNHTATFYDRYKVYANLGFDTFTSIEYMQDAEYNPIGWAKDTILTEYVFKALNSTPNADFVFAVSVQGHGKYPNTLSDTASKITVSGIDEDRLCEMEFYVNQLYETDAFIGELYNAVMAFEEDTVLVLYGDHMPALKISEYELENNDLYQTDYVILSNFELNVQDDDINAYELFPKVLEALGISNGYVNKIHSAYKNNTRFDDILRIIGYDMLYGEQIAYNASYPYTSTEMLLGIDTISVTDTVQSSEGFYVYGSNFTPFSNVFNDSKKLDTEFINANTLYVAEETLEYGDKISVVQISSDFRKLSQTDAYVYTRGFLD